MILKLGSISIKDRHIWFLYFLVMQCFYTITLVQLFAQLFVLVWVFMPAFTKRKLSLSAVHLRSVLEYITWYGVFVAFVILSKLWAYGIHPESKTIVTCIRIFAMGLAMIMYATSREKVFVLLKSMIYAAVVMGILALTTTPISMYGKASSEGFGTALGYHRNFYGYYMGICAVVSYYLDRYAHFQFGRLFGVFFVVVCLCTGSRSGLLQLCLICIFLVLLEQNIVKKMKYILLGGIACLLVFSILYNSSYFREVYIERILSALHLTAVEDPSAKGRNSYRIIAMGMFMSSPIGGYGLDGFICFLTKNPMIAGYHLDAVYSHCNLVELLANFGIIGFVIYYSMHLKVIIMSYKNRKVDVWSKLMLVLMFVSVVMDYYGITYQTHLFIYLYVILFAYCKTLQSHINHIREEKKSNIKGD